MPKSIAEINVSLTKDFNGNILILIVKVSFKKEYRNKCKIYSGRPYLIEIIF